MQANKDQAAKLQSELAEAQSRQQEAAKKAKEEMQTALQAATQRLRQVKERMLADAEQTGKKPRRGPGPAETLASMEEATKLEQQASNSQAANMDIEDTQESSQQKQKPEDKLFNKIVEDRRVQTALRSKPYSFRP